MLVVNTEDAYLDIDSQSQLDYLFDYIERLETQASVEASRQCLAQPLVNHLKYDSIISNEELAMLTLLFSPKTNNQ